ncbi:hypothetical protein [Clostridium culturomicium]|uniref:hypothetical protein n=1 Tax=Clostridium culturomicium TaxID=1499683 RepID=UPI00058F4152|nr:hypothetical protein [Clostridium culturomicium]
MIYYDNKQFETEYKFEVYLLSKYLTKHYNQDTAIKLIKKHSKNLDNLAKSLAKSDIGFFCEYFLMDIFVPADGNLAKKLSPDHYELWELANRTFVKDEMDKVNIVCPRGFAKTTIFDMAVIVWSVCYKESIFTILISKDNLGAIKFLDDIKKVFKENKKIINSFGKLINNKKFTVNGNEIEFTNGCDLQSVGSGTSIRGRKYKNNRPTLVIGDDAQSDTDILTDDARQKKYDLWCKQVEEVGNTATYRNGKKINKSTKIISIGTILHIDCLISRLCRNKSYYTMLKRAIILKPEQSVDDIFESELWLKCKKLYFNDKAENSKDEAYQFYLDNIENMKFPVLWEDSWDCFNDLAVKYWENRQTFMSEKMNDATSIGEKWFKSVLTQTKEEIEQHEFIKTMLCIDPASTTNKKSDYTAMVVGSTGVNNFKYMRELVLDKLEFNKYCEKVVEVLLAYPDITHVYIEKNTYQGADIIKIKELISTNDILHRRNLEFINEMQRSNKDEKISTIIDNVNNGQIIFVDNNKEFTDLILDFQGQKYTLHDDSIDITAECVRRLDDIKSNNKITLLDRRLLGL